MLESTGLRLGSTEQNQIGVLVADIRKATSAVNKRWWQLLGKETG